MLSPAGRSDRQPLAVRYLPFFQPANIYKNSGAYLNKAPYNFFGARSLIVRLCVYRFNLGLTRTKSRHGELIWRKSDDFNSDVSKIEKKRKKKEKKEIFSKIRKKGKNFFAHIFSQINPCGLNDQLIVIFNFAQNG